MFVSYTERSLVRSQQSAAANWMTEDGQLWPMPREIWPHMLTSMAETPLSGFTAT